MIHFVRVERQPFPSTHISTHTSTIEITPRMTTTIQSVERAFSILECFDEHHPSRSASEIAAETNLARPTTYRMLQTLEQLGYVRNQSGRFQVTPRVLRLGAGSFRRHGLASAAQPVLDQLADELDEHVALATLDGADVIAVAVANSSRSRLLSVAVQVGQRLPARETSLGRVLLAHQPGADRELASIREVGHAVVDGTLESGLRAVAIPVLDRTGHVIAAMAVAVNAGRVGLDELESRCLPPMRRAARTIAMIET
jgi:IclR family pca regulon transcriptional regulator